jgi:outer membrane protein TolC
MKFSHITAPPLAALLLTLVTARLDAQPVEWFVARAIDTHPSLRGAQLAIEANDARARSLLAWEAPRLSIDATDLPPGNLDPLSHGEAMFTAEQNIPIFGQNRAMSDAAALESDAARANLESLRFTLRSRVEQAYYGLWLIDRRAALTTLNRKHAEILYNAAEARYETERTPQSDLFKMSSEIESIATSEKELAEDRAAALAQLNALLGRPIDTPVALDDSLRTAELPPFDSLATALGSNPDLARMEAMAAAARAEADAQDRMLKPMLMVRGGLGYMPEGHPLRQANIPALVGEHAAHEIHPISYLGLSAGVTFTLPFAPWSRTGPEELAESHRLEAEERLHDRDAMRLEMIADLRSAYARARRARARIDFYRMTQLPLIDKTFESALGDYTNNRAPFSSLIDAYHMRAIAYEDLYMQQADYAMALSMINQLAGGRP